MTSSAEVTRLLQRIGPEGREVYSELLPLVYDELHGIARAYLSHERPDHTLQATALVHEAWMRLAPRQAPGWNDRKHFYRAAAMVMRSVLVNHARDRGRLKRLGTLERLPLDDALASYEDRAIDLVALDEALERLGKVAPRQASLVELRFFAGLSVDEAAGVLDVSPRTVDMDWRLARAWLLRELQDGERAG